MTKWLPSEEAEVVHAENGLLGLFAIVYVDMLLGLTNFDALAEFTL